jgi:hypothetical protein
MQNWGCFVEQKLMLSSSFWCYQIHNCQECDVGHTVALLKLEFDVRVKFKAYLNVRFQGTILHKASSFQRIKIINFFSKSAGLMRN